jgi:hypothetical protein
MGFEGASYHDVMFKAAHNSEEHRERLAEQLAWDERRPWQGGCSGLELDVAQDGQAWRWSVSHDRYTDRAERQLGAYLDELRGWSDAHPEHRVITVVLDLKSGVRDGAAFAAAFDDYIARSFPVERLYTPGQLMGSAPDLVTGAMRGGWPSLAALRGRFIFCLSGDAPGRWMDDLKETYAATEAGRRLCFADRRLSEHGQRPSTAAGRRVFCNFDFQRVQDWGDETIEWFHRQRGFITRGYLANDARLWGMALGRGVNVIATDRIQGHDWATVGSTPFWPVPRVFWGVETALDALTASAPALAAVAGRLYLAYRGGASTRLHVRAGDGRSWEPGELLADKQGAATSAAPALAVLGGRLALVYRDAGSSALWLARYDGQAWEAPRNITQENGARTDAAPALAALDERLHLVYRGATDSDLWHCQYDGQAWSAPRSITADTGARTATAPALAALGGRLHLVYRGDRTPDLCDLTYDGTRWSTPRSLTEINGARTARAPALAALGDVLHVLYQGQGSTDVWTCCGRDGEWSGQVCVSALNQAGAMDGLGAAALGDTLCVVARARALGDMYGFTLGPVSESG